MGKKHANAKVFDKVFREIVKKLGIPFNLNFKLGEDFRMIDIVENRNAPVVTFAPFDITGETGFTFSGGLPTATVGRMTGITREIIEED